MKRIIQNILLVIGLFAIGGCTEKQELSDEQLNSEINISEIDQRYDYQLSEKRNLPEAKENGKNKELEYLLPLYARAYEDDELLKEDVKSYRQWQWEKLYDSLDKKELNNPETLDVYRLQAEIYSVNQLYEDALSQLDQVLRREPIDVHALTQTIILKEVLGDSEGKNRRMTALHSISKEDASYLEAFLTETKDLINTDYESEKIIINPEIIAVFGSSPKAEGTVSSGLQKRLNKARLLAEEYPEAKVIVSGGKVNTDFVEADVMFDWLVKYGVAEERIIKDADARDTVGNVIGIIKISEELELTNVLAVSSIRHLPRAVTALAHMSESESYPLQIGWSGSDVKPADKIVEQEAAYSYINAARAAKLFSKDDFK